MVNITIDSSGVVRAITELKKSLDEVNTIGRILQYATSVIWIPLIMDRLDQSTSKSGYKNELDSTMYDLDPEFVEYMNNNSRFSMTEAERRISGGYKPGEITSNIKKAITPSQPIKGDGYIAIGIGDKDLLNELAGPIGENSQYPIWEILQWGTGEYSPNGSPIVRNGLQIFFNRKEGRGVAVKRTVNSGFAGREYFVQLDGDIHHADYSVMEYVLGYMRKMVKKYSYK